MTIGHEFVGEIVEVGGTRSRTSSRATGSRARATSSAAIAATAAPGASTSAATPSGVGVNRPGAFAEYLVIPAHNAYKLPEDMPDEIAAILDPFGNAAHTALSFDLVGEDVLITGAGPIGIMAGAIAKPDRRAPRRHHRRQRLPPGAGPARWAPHTVNVAETASTRRWTDDLGMRRASTSGLEMSAATPGARTTCSRSS